MSSVLAVLPVKSLAEVKSRLGASLSQDERSELAVQMLRNSTNAVLDSGAVARCAIVSPDEAVLELSIVLGCYPLAQESGGLNAAMDLGRNWARRHGAERLLILLPDLPLLAKSEVAELTALGAAGRIVLAPDRHGAGTNGMLVETEQPFNFHFGVDSLRLHKQEALRLGLEIELFSSTGTRFDIDTPLDLQQWQLITEELKIG